MSDQFIGEVRLCARTTPSPGFLLCDGRLLNQPDYPELYSVIGLRYGGAGTGRFAIPDLRGRVAVHFGPQLPLGQSGGSERIQRDTAPSLSGVALPTPGDGPLTQVENNPSNYQPGFGLHYMIAYRGVHPSKNEF